MKSTWYLLGVSDLVRGAYFGAMLTALVILLSGCVTPPIAHPTQPTGGIVVAPGHKSFMISQLRHDLMIAHGVPMTYFTSAPGDVDFPWRMDAEHVDAAYDIMQHLRNP